VNKNFFYSELGFEQLTDCSDISHLNPEYRELGKIGADKVHFSGDFPAVLFKEVSSFSEPQLKEIIEIQRRAWNYRKVIFLFVMSDTEIRIYNCYEKPHYLKQNANVDSESKKYEVFSSHKNDTEKLNILVELFSRTGVDCGLIWTTEYDIRKKINVQKRIDRYLVESLVKTAKILRKEITDKGIVHGLLMRSLFILYLEDKGAAREAGLYSQIKPDAKSYLDILEDVDATYKLFDVLQEHFNGNVFPVTGDEQKIVTPEHLSMIKRCFIDGGLSGNPVMFDDWRVFDFSFIQIELLSEVYENFLGELDEKKAKGQFYTPYSLVELILNDKLPAKNETNHNVKTLDITCGSGIFLVESYKRLIRRWKNAHLEAKQIPFDVLCKLLKDNIFGIEFDPLAIKVAAFSLYLALVEQLDPKTLWIEKGYRLPYLINNPDDPSLKDKQGENLWRRDTIKDIDAESFVVKADLIVGNPPFGTGKIEPHIKEYLTKHKFAQETVLAFMYKAALFVAPKGEIALIFNTKVLTNTNTKYRNFRKWLFNKAYVEKVYNLSIFRKAKKDFGGQLFHSATVPISIVYYQNKQPQDVSDTIEYCAPKTYVKSNLIDGLVIDSTDIKFLPRHECQKPDTKIWKVAMWGSQQDFAFLEILTKRNNLLSSDKRFITGKGLCCDSKKPDFIPNHIIPTKSVGRYQTKAAVKQDNTRHYRKDNNCGILFTPPYAVVKEMQHCKQIAASLIDYNSFCTTGTYIINGQDIPLYIKKMLVAFYNSEIVRYFLFLTSASWGIERDRVCLLNELLEIPSFLSENTENKVITHCFDNIINQLESGFPNRQIILNNEKTILHEFYKILKINKKEQILIEDGIKYNLSLFEQGEQSIGFRRTLPEENKAYAQMICDELNDFLQHSQTKVSATIYDMQVYDPLNLTVLHFGNTKEKETVTIEKGSELKIVLNELNKYVIREKRRNMYVQKQFIYYDDDKIYLIKPNQKRFWTRSQAMEDAKSLIVEIISMGNK
jgi:hypothetical protein